MNKMNDILYGIRQFLKKINKTVVIIIAISLICSISIAIGIYAQITNKKIIETDKDNMANNEAYQQLKLEFNNLFNNEENKYISMEYDIEQDKKRSI